MRVLIPLLLAVVLFSIACDVLGKRYTVAGDGMAPTLAAGATVVARKTNEYTRGDIIVFEQPNNRERIMIKRIVGLPGETIEAKEGKVFISDLPLEEPYVPEPMTYTIAKLTIPAGQFYVLGDNRNHSSDSHEWGSVATDYIQGVAKP